MLLNFTISPYFPSSAFTSAYFLLPFPLICLYLLHHHMPSHPSSVQLLPALTLHSSEKLRLLPFYLFYSTLPNGISPRSKCFCKNTKYR